MDAYNYNVIAWALAFEWDGGKSHENKRKHGLSFEDAREVFFDENALLIHDPDHSEGEARFLLLGLGAKLRMLVVHHVYRKDDKVIRII
jgi:uncharacterized protein